jgi:hypothetical protein
MHKKYALMLLSAMGALAVDFSLPRQAMAAWQPYGNTNPITSTSSNNGWIWKCGPTKEVTSSILSQVCLVRTSDKRYLRGAVIVRNNRSSLFNSYANVKVADSISTIRSSSCSSSGVGANSWSVCYGGDFFSWPYSAYADGSTNGVPLSQTVYALIRHLQIGVAYSWDKGN